MCSYSGYWIGDIGVYGLTFEGQGFICHLICKLFIYLFTYLFICLCVSTAFIC